LKATQYFRHANGEEALAVVQNFPVDVAILEYKNAGDGRN